MASIDKLPEHRLMQVLASKGLLDEIDLGDDDIIQPMTQQLIQFRPNDLSKSERAVAILVSGQNNSANAAEVDDKNYTIVIAGQANPGDILFCRLIAEEFQRVLTDSLSWGMSIIGLTNNGIAGPFYEKDGRPIYEISGRVLMNKICDESPVPIINWATPNSNYWIILPRFLNSGAPSASNTFVAFNGQTAVYGQSGGYAARSVDGGMTWLPLVRGLNSGSATVNINDMCMSADGLTIIVVFDSGYAALSVDGGITWVGQQRGLAFTTSTANIRACSTNSDGSVIIAGNQSGQVSLSTNYGANWVQQPVGLNSGTITIIQSICMSIDGSTILVGMYEGWGAMSTNSGLTWVPVIRGFNTGSNGNVIASCMSDSGQYMYVGTSTGGAAMSSDFGATWSPLPVNLGNVIKGQIFSMSCTPDGKKIVASVGNGGVSYSEDFGATWAEMPPGIVTGFNILMTSMKFGRAGGDNEEGRGKWLVSQFGGRACVTNPPALP